ncbi:MAG: hypothetical protein ACJ0DG_07405 [bacterium]|mgnify:FL=1|tara:strand:+ start:383 stop:634 length:252 start_codon:yes stop_codon:yes gene_type:complete
MNNANILKFFLVVFFGFTITSCAKIEERNNLHSRILLFRINNVGNLQASSDGKSWISNTSEKTKNPWIDVLAGVKQNFRTISR